jgi:hypothetical protein
MNSDGSSHIAGQFSAHLSIGYNSKICIMPRTAFGPLPVSIGDLAQTQNRAPD